MPKSQKALSEYLYSECNNHNNFELVKLESVSWANTPFNLSGVTVTFKQGAPTEAGLKV